MNGNGGYFAVSNVNNPSPAIGASTAGTGPAINATINNAASTNAAIYAATNGTGSAFSASTTGTGSALTAFNNGPGGAFSPAANFSIEVGTNNSPTIQAQTKGTGQAASFFINNAASSNFAVGIGTNGTGPALNVSTATGFASIYATHSGAGNIIQVDHSGTGIAGAFSISNVASTAPALSINHSGTGNAISANRPIQATQFIGDGSALTGISAALLLPFAGSSSTVGNTFDVTSTATSGNVARFVTNNAANAGDAVAATTNGTGNAMDISVTNAASVAPVLNISHAGNANGILSNREINVNNTSTNTGGGSFTVANGGNANTALFSSTNGAGLALSAVTTGTGPGGNIQIGNAANTQNALNVQTSGTGRGINLILSNVGNTNPAINIINSGTGNAITANRPIQATQFIGDGSLLTGLPSSGWGLTGSAGTVDGTNFIGTTDNVPLNFKFNNQRAGRIAGSNTYFGVQAGDLNTGGDNTAIGSFALTSNTTGASNSATGYSALSSNTSGNFNLAFGTSALQSNTTGSNNIGIGINALSANTVGTSNLAIGQNANVLSNNLTKATAIGFNAKVGASNSLVLGGTGADAVNVGIGTSTPLSKLQVGTMLGIFTDTGNSQEVISRNLYYDGANFRYATTNTASALGLGNERIGLFTFPTASAGSVLSGGPSMRFNLTTIGLGIQVDNPQEILHVNGATLLNPITAPGTTTDRLYNVGGNLFWNGTNISSAGSNWGLTGTAGTVDGTNFIGTTDNIPLSFKVNNQKAGKIDPAGSLYLGYLAGNATTTTILSNTGIGSGALQSNTTGAFNTATGSNALQLNTTGSSNTAFGSFALNFNTTGIGNTAMGPQNLQVNTTGNGNTAIGNQVLQSNTIGSNNTGLGFQALQFNTTGGSSTAIGYQALTAATGSQNTAVGFRAMTASTNAIQNVAVGMNALLANTTGSQNTAVGYGSLNSNIGGGFNVGLGMSSLNANTTGSNNIALGYQSVFTNILGNNNVGIGSQALQNTNANNNVAVGVGAGAFNTTGTNNTYLGNSANATVNNLTNATAIGANATVSASNSLVLGNNANVGIGTTAPLSKLQVTGVTSFASRAAGTLLDINTTTIDNNAYIRFTQDGPTLQNPVFVGVDNDSGISEFWNQDGLDMRFGTNNTERMRISSAGNVGIGTSAPQSALDVVGQVFGRNGVTAGVPGNGNQQLQMGVGSGFSTVQAINPSVAFNNLSLNPSGGDVGIGTTNPGITTGASKYLSIVNGGSYSASSITSIEVQGNINSGNSPAGRLDFINGLTPTTISRVEGITSSGSTVQGGLRFFTNNGTLNESMRITSAGNVGIGTTAPIYPLQVNPTANYTNASTHGVLQFTGATTNTPTNLAVSIYSTGAVLAPWFWAFSDKRIKEKVSGSNTADDLKLLMRLNVTDYNYVDKVTKGSRLQKGFIAQEVKEVLPDAVNILPNSEFIPSIYSQSKSITRQDEGLMIELTMAHELKVGDRVRLLDGAVEFKETVTEIPSSTSFKVKNTSIEANTVFVYGKEISDMHTIEYDRIYTLGISATQELNKKLEAEMAKNQLLETESKKKIAELEKMLQTLKGENKKLSAEVTETKTKQEQEIAALKKQMEKIMNIVGAEAKK